MKKIFSIILAYILVLSCITVTAKSNVQFDDLPSSHWGYRYVEECVTQGIMKGMGNNNFSPDASISVAEVIAVAVRLAGIKTETSGENWYDGAVNAAIQSGIIKAGQFDSYTRPATRAEVAGMLGVVKPESYYKGINNIYSIYDVDDMTPYNGEIFKLYRAGILTGSGNNAAFEPYKNISRVEAAAIISRLLDEGLRQNFTIAGKVADYTVKTTDKRVNIGGVYGYGVVEIGGRYFIMLELFKSTYGEANGNIFGFYKDTDSYSFRLGPAYPDAVAYTLDYSFAMPSGVIMGTAERAPEKLYMDDKECYNSVYTIGGRFPMVSLEAIGAIAEGNDFVIPMKEYPAAIKKEVDLVGNALGNLQRQNNKDTVKAIHDYIVNTITYNPTVSAPSGITQAKLEEVRQIVDNAEETYIFDSNVTLASKYGVCHNYAVLFNEMCLRSGIPCFYVEGSASWNGYLGGHAWNMVYIDDKWQYVDVTWDDPVSNKPELRHSYFLISADKLANTHIWKEYPMPAEYDPAWEQLDPNNITSTDMFRKCLVAQVAMGKTKFSLRVTKSGAYGGNMCLYLYPECFFWSMSSRYNSSTGTYDYVVE